MNNLVVVAGGSALSIGLVMAVTFFVGERIGRHNVVDVAWGPAFAAVALVSAALGSGDPSRRGLLAVLIAIWGVRLAGYLAVRSAGHGEDPRYEALLAKSKGSRRFAVLTRIYLLQGVLVWIIALPVQVSAIGTGALNGLAIAGIALWLIGFAFESIGDAQMLAYKRDPSNRGTVMNRGLWRYTRHPNYFGDAVLWWGLFLIAVSGAPAVWFTVLGPLVMTTLLVRVSGKALLERHMADRPGYSDYVARTSGFFPWRPSTAP